MCRISVNIFLFLHLQFLDSDVFITNPQCLKLLISKGHTVAAPMMKSDGLYSNFWCGMTEEYYYLRTDDYKPILNRERIGCFHVPMVHSSVLVDLCKLSSNGLTFLSSKVPDYKGPHDDIITFALAANKSGMYEWHNVLTFMYDKLVKKGRRVQHLPNSCLLMS